MERQSTIQQGVLKKKRGVHSGSCSSSTGKAEDWKAEAVRYRWGGPVRSSEPVSQMAAGRVQGRPLTLAGGGRGTQRTDQGSRQACGARLTAGRAGVRGTAYCKRGRRAGTAYCKEGRGRARLSPRRQTLAAKAEKTIDSIVRAQCEPK
ncbi:BZ3500_MvSof-1268-A1-R1_Chr8-1g09846 [Microbotryum saponariae]|uniref:BZ3500_MvSof-1268-A1-R1_Chr8-1g09846 protein n=1 Tax=Microbotryum saponariae TaxID=289078 RepID=A0A2X0MUU0_9BASI|nr:BZ3500_MvSof-1268-A1-R1_Chr8-1g09846 [Microbotryum saponariae]SDA08132.1 BZ3501_MvSof-1269-A2-R1_Chr8-1g09569 [Microbotryum saponariae]